MSRTSAAISFGCVVAVLLSCAILATADNCCGKICCNAGWVCIQLPKPHCCRAEQACGNPATDCCNSNQTCWVNEGTCKVTTCHTCNATCKEECGEACGSESSIDKYDCTVTGTSVSLTCQCLKGHKAMLPKGFWIYVGVGGALLAGCIVIGIVWKVRSRKVEDYQPLSTN